MVKVDWSWRLTRKEMQMRRKPRMPMMLWSPVSSDETTFMVSMTSFLWDVTEYGLWIWTVCVIYYTIEAFSLWYKDSSPNWFLVASNLYATWVSPETPTKTTPNDQVLHKWRLILRDTRNHHCRVITVWTPAKFGKPSAIRISKLGSLGFFIFLPEPTLKTDLYPL